MLSNPIVGQVAPPLRRRHLFRMTVPSSPSHPLLIPEIAQLVCDQMDPRDLFHVAFTCKILFSAACRRIWRHLHLSSVATLRKVARTLSGQHARRGPFLHYQDFVHSLRLCLDDFEPHSLQRDFFTHFSFPNLEHLHVSFAAADDSVVYRLLAASRHLDHVDLSHCFGITGQGIQPLFRGPARLKSLILYGCSRLTREELGAVIQHHRETLECIHLTDINNDVLSAIQTCPLLTDLGLEHCSHSLDSTALLYFWRNKLQKLTRLRLRDIALLNASHFEDMAKHTCSSLVHLDMSECPQVPSEAICQITAQCTRLESIILSCQPGVTNQVVQFLLRNCRCLRHLDLSGSRLLTSEAFKPLTDGSIDHEIVLEKLNISGLPVPLSPGVVFKILQTLPSIRELCLGVSFSVMDASNIIFHLNMDQGRFYFDKEQYHTICRVSK